MIPFLSLPHKTDIHTLLHNIQNSVEGGTRLVAPGGLTAWPPGRFLLLQTLVQNLLPAAGHPHRVHLDTLLRVQ